ncbi:MAG: peptidoglycan recognition family protein [Candidatus Parcubacteria bacterium]|nr:peptidoglycan recognition family protein [Candidatus Parcubacteria bacterium]
MAYLRAIQYYHAKTREWGDIGYNYLIDSKGNIYEGRKGGDGVVGGHAYMNNQNSIGIAILGCYDTGNNGQKNSTCNTPTQLTEETKTALAKLIAKKSQEFNIDPLGTSEFKGKMLPNIIGHKDVGNTTCPGNLIYDALPKIRELAAADLLDLGGFKKPLPTSAEFVSLSNKEINIEETKTAEVFAEFKNTGQETWRGYEDNYLYVSDSNLKNKIARIDSVKIALESDKDQANTGETNQSIYKLIAGNVYTGEIGRFKLVLTPPTDKVTLTENYTLAWLNKGFFPNTDFSIAVTKIPCQSCLSQNNNPAPIYQVALASFDLPDQIIAENIIPVKIVLTNTGNQIWDKDKLKLKIVYEQTNISPFKNNSWYDEYASILPNEKTIYPQANATFEFKLKAPALLTTFPHTLTLNYDDKQLWQLDKTLEVISPYAAQITKNTLPQSAKPNSRPKVTLTFKNTGTKDWTLPALKSYDLDNTNSWFKDWSWLDSKTVKKAQKTIKPGEEIEFNFRLLAYWKQNTYPQVFRLYSGKNQIYLAGQKELIMKTKVAK